MRSLALAGIIALAILSLAIVVPAHAATPEGGCHGSTTNSHDSAVPACCSTMACCLMVMPAMPAIKVSILPVIISLNTQEYDFIAQSIIHRLERPPRVYINT